MRFHDGGEPHDKAALPSEYPLGVMVEDLENGYAHIYVIMREKIYKMDPVTMMSLLKRYSEGVVDNDAENAPDLEKVRNATQALRGLVGRN